MAILETRELRKNKIFNYNHQVCKSIDLNVISEKLKKMLSELSGPLEHPYYKIHSTGVWAKKLYAWDGVTGSKDSKYLRVPSLIHDIGCQAVNNEFLPREFRAAFDREYYEQSLLYNPYPEGTILNKLVKLRAFIEYIIIRLWGMIPKGKEKDKFAIIHRILLKS